MLTALLAPAGMTDAQYTIYITFTLLFMALMFVAALVAILVVLFQKSNSDGIQGITGSSETFFGKNKGRSLDSKMKKWTIIVLVILAVLALVFFILQFDTIWWIGYERP